MINLSANLNMLIISLFPNQVEAKGVGFKPSSHDWEFLGFAIAAL
jgi:hypothetical protein